MSTYIVFELEDNGFDEGRKTAIWNVLAKAGGYLGQVRWFGRWRKYSFFPAPGCVFEGVCMREISQFIEDRTRDRRLSGAGDRNIHEIASANGRRPSQSDQP